MEQAHPLRTYWWRYDYPGRLNYGDELTPLIISTLLKLPIKWADPAHCQLASTGSILELLGELGSDNSIAVWGSGYIRGGGLNKQPNLSFHAVRGHLTRRRITDKPMAVGDPALLLPLLFKEPVEQRNDIGIMPHYVDMNDERLAEFIRKTPNSLMISVLDKPEKVIQDIRSCKHIISSGLHGLITADAFDIPNRHMASISGLLGGDYKFHDYYSVYDNFAVPPAISIDDIVRATTDQSLSNSWFTYDTPDTRQIAGLQQGLIDSFPAELIRRS